MLEPINVVIDCTPEDKKEVKDEDDVTPQWTDVLPKVSNIDSKSKNSENPQINKGPLIKVQKDHHVDSVIGNMNEGVITKFREMIANSCFISKIEPKNIKEVLTDEFWIYVMQEELCQFKRNKVW